MSHYDAENILLAVFLVIIILFADPLAEFIASHIFANIFPF